MTLGFKPKHQYNARQLKAVCSVFSEVLKNKGSIKSIQIACQALFSAMDISQGLDYDFTPNTAEDKTELNLYIAQDFGDITILKDLLSYTLPAGMSCNIIREFHVNNVSNTNIGISSTVSTYELNTELTSQLQQLSETNITATGVLKTSDAIKALINNKAGYSINSEIVRLEDKNNG